jgi:cellulose synthase/poly-beta-1,6-N-acetylglucosamine synthase-like glycosyltransferase
MATMVLLSVYFAILGILALFGVHRLLLCWWARPAASRNMGAPPLSAKPETDWPSVLVQLPIYNEQFVETRILEAAARLDYPKDRLLIQVLDDSTDETRDTISRKVAALHAQGCPITLLRRGERQGYKAGALAHGLQQSQHEFVAVFDADFIPSPDFLQQSIPHLIADPKCGMVQARWTHLNRGASILTRAQALFLDGHFAIEHRGRDQAGRCFNFNGTAGVWRRKTINEAGGWRSLTITEDFDLSYRAQLKGWRFKFCHHIHVPAELPESWVAFRSQQARWTRGSIETSQLLFKDVVFAKQWSLAKRFEAAVHLCSNLSYALMACLGLLLPPAVILRHQMGWRVPSGQTLLSILDISMLTAGTFAMFVFYARAIAQSKTTENRGSFIDIPLALCLGAGLSLGNAREVVRGFFSKNSEFVRTPKSGPAEAMLVRKAYSLPPQMRLLSLEIGFSVYYIFAISYALRAQLWTAIPFLLLYLTGFLMLSLGVMSEVWGNSKAQLITNQVRPRAERL